MGDKQLGDNPRAHRIPNDVRAANPEMIQQTDNIQPHLAAIRSRVVWFSALAVPARIESNNSVIPRKVGRDS
jgi:hypothetical protein